MRCNTRALKTAPTWFTMRDFSSRYCSIFAPWMIPLVLKWTSMYLPKRLELSLRLVLALPNAAQVKAFAHLNRPIVINIAPTQCMHVLTQPNHALDQSDSFIIHDSIRTVPYKVMFTWFTIIHCLAYIIQRPHPSSIQWSPSMMGLASRICCSIQECWPLTAARNCKMSFVDSVFPAPLSPLQKSVRVTSI